MQGEISLNYYRPMSVFGSLYHFCIALIPVLYIFKFPVLNISLGTVVILAVVPYSIMYILKGINKNYHIHSYVFLLFYVYLILRSDGNTTRIVLCISTFLILWGQMKGATDNARIRNIIEVFALINVALLVIQVVSYYGVHIHIQYLPRVLIYEEYQESYVFRELSGLYRPSALFLEPSHFSQYCIFALISALFPASGPVRMKRAIAIGTGCILTTSGMGIALTFGVFAWYVFLNKQRINKKLLIIIGCIPVLLVALLVLSRTAFFQTAIQSVFSNVDGYNAVSGRIHNWDDAIGTMHGSLLWFGYGDNYNYKLYLTGLADMIYKYGILSIVLEGSCFLYLMIKKKNSYIWCCCVVFIILFCVAHITNFVAQVFYFGILIADASVEKTKYEGVISGQVF